ncbi:MAG TPA: hypothetical protein VJY33_21365, partial [Isosphaeraceae bacterium]|nr:hypothetical protein [Isosphaeraceae bacterium]
MARPLAWGAVAETTYHPGKKRPPLVPCVTSGAAFACICRTGRRRLVGPGRINQAATVQVQTHTFGLEIVAYDPL